MLKSRPRQTTFAACAGARAGWATGQVACGLRWAVWRAPGAGTVVGAILVSALSAAPGCPAVIM